MRNRSLQSEIRTASEGICEVHANRTGDPTWIRKPAVRHYPGFGPPCRSMVNSIMTAVIPVRRSPHQLQHRKVGKNTGPRWNSGPAIKLVLLFASFLAATFASQRFL